MMTLTPARKMSRFLTFIVKNCVWLKGRLGAESGARGIFIGSFAGVLMPPGGAVVLYGLVGGLWKSGCAA